MKSFWAECILTACLSSGCSESPPPLTPRAPHGGTLVKLPDGRANAEIVRQDLADKPGQTRLLLYYYDAEFKPMGAAPTAATLKRKGRGAAPVEFKPSGDADPTKVGELASSPFQADGDVAGEISAIIDGKPVAVTVNIR